MQYAKINEQGNVIEFPYKELSRPDFLLEQQELPNDAVQVDTETNKPTQTWDKKLFYDNVEKIGDKYVLNYRIEDRFNTFEEKSDRFKQLVNEMHARNERWLEEKTAELNNFYPFSEQQSWSVQREEALRFREDSSFVPPLLSVVAEERGISVEEMVSKVLENVEFYNVAFGRILGVYQKNRALLNSINFGVEDDSWGNYSLVFWE